MSQQDDLVYLLHILKHHDKTAAISKQIITTLQAKNLSLKVLSTYDHTTLADEIDSWKLDTFGRKLCLIRGLLVSGIKDLQSRDRQQRSQSLYIHPSSSDAKVNQNHNPAIKSKNNATGSINISVSKPTSPVYRQKGTQQVQSEQFEPGAGVGLGAGKPLISETEVKMFESLAEYEASIATRMDEFKRDLYGNDDNYGYSVVANGNNVNVEGDYRDGDSKNSNDYDYDCNCSDSCSYDGYIKKLLNEYNNEIGIIFDNLICKLNQRKQQLIKRIKTMFDFIKQRHDDYWLNLKIIKLEINNIKSQYTSNLNNYKINSMIDLTNRSEINCSMINKLLSKYKINDETQSKITNLNYKMTDYNCTISFSHDLISNVERIISNLGSITSDATQAKKNPKISQNLNPKDVNNNLTSRTRSISINLSNSNNSTNYNSNKSMKQSQLESHSLSPKLNGNYNHNYNGNGTTTTTTNSKKTSMSVKKYSLTDNQSDADFSFEFKTDDDDEDLGFDFNRLNSGLSFGSNLLNNKTTIIDKLTVLESNKLYKFENLQIINNGILTVDGWDIETRNGGIFNIKCDSLILDNNGKIDLTGKGYEGGQLWGYQGYSYANNKLNYSGSSQSQLNNFGGGGGNSLDGLGGGGGYGTNGNDGFLGGKGGISFGNSKLSLIANKGIYMGSGGGGINGTCGGGIIIIQCTKWIKLLSKNCKIIANGENAIQSATNNNNNTNDKNDFGNVKMYVGCGSGGSIYLRTPVLLNNGSIEAIGGRNVFGDDDGRNGGNNNDNVKAQTIASPKQQGPIRKFSKRKKKSSINSNVGVENKIQENRTCFGDGGMGRIRIDCTKDSILTLKQSVINPGVGYWERLN